MTPIFDMKLSEWKTAINALEDSQRRAEALGLTKENWPTDWQGIPVPFGYIEAHPEQFGLRRQ